MELPGAVVGDARTSSYKINSSFVLRQFDCCYFVFLKWIVLVLNIYLGHLRLRKSLFKYNVTVCHPTLPIYFMGWLVVLGGGAGGQVVRSQWVCCGS